MNKNRMGIKKRRTPLRKGAAVPAWKQNEINLELRRQRNRNPHYKSLLGIRHRWGFRDRTLLYRHRNEPLV